ncbi:MAG TPA: chondroitinase-B domain-containing protein [Thermoguttaceae bacterium]|nr:chondroitinase-B domain-containing protein [Thermoguttaceae bacterium]
MKANCFCSPLCVLYAASLLGQASAVTYYASPQGGGNGSSADRPFAVSRFGDKAQPGDALLLLDGVYTGAEAMIDPPRGLRGTSAAPITIRAANDGQVTLDGQGRANPVMLRGNDWFVVEGINAHHAKATVVEISRSNHCIIRRVRGWDAADGDTNIFAAHYGEYGLFEDCAGWGIARKTFSCSQGGNYTTFRRRFGCWEGCHAVGPKMAFTWFYNSHHITAENCIATWNGRLMREQHTALGSDGRPFTAWKDGSAKPRHYTDYGVDQPYGCFSADRIDSGPTKGPSVYGCIAYRLKSQRVADGVESGRAAWKQVFQPQQQGAHIYYCYENGKLTDKPLWPRPPNQRIK